MTRNEHDRILNEPRMNHCDFNKVFRTITRFKLIIIDIVSIDKLWRKISNHETSPEYRKQKHFYTVNFIQNDHHSAINKITPLFMGGHDLDYYYIIPCSCCYLGIFEARICQRGKHTSVGFISNTQIL